MTNKPARTISPAQALARYIETALDLSVDMRAQVDGTTMQQLLDMASLHDIFNALKDLPLDGSDETEKAANVLGDLYMKKFDRIAAPVEGGTMIDNRVNASHFAMQRRLLQSDVEHTVTGITTGNQFWRDTNIEKLAAVTESIEPQPSAFARLVRRIKFGLG